MERLNEIGRLTGVKKLSDRWMYYCGLLACMGVSVDDMKHIQSLIDAEEQGLLLRLPCKVGDTLYQVISSVEEYKVTAIGIYENKLVICTDNLKTGIGFSFDANRIGKRYFLTKEAAEAALAKMKEV